MNTVELPELLQALSSRKSENWSAKLVSTKRGQVWRASWTEVQQRQTWERVTIVRWYAWGEDGYAWGSYSRRGDAIDAAESL